MAKSIFFKELEKKINKDIDMVKKAAAKALNSSARKARTAVAKQEAKVLQFKSKKFKKAIQITRATKDNLEAVISFPDTASEPMKDGKKYLMIPLKKGLKDFGQTEIKRDLAIPLLKYANENPHRKKKRVAEPHAFFKLQSGKTGQELIAVRQKNDREKMHWLFAGRKGEDCDFAATVDKVANANLKKDFDRELAKMIEKS